MSSIDWKPRNEPPASDGIYLVHDGMTYFTAEYSGKDDSFYSTVADDRAELGRTEYWAEIRPLAPSDECA